MSHSCPRALAAYTSTLNTFFVCDTCKYGLLLKLSYFYVVFRLLPPVPYFKYPAKIKLRVDPFDMTFEGYPRTSHDIGHRGIRSPTPSVSSPSLIQILSSSVLTPSHPSSSSPIPSNSFLSSTRQKGMLEIPKGRDGTCGDRMDFVRLDNHTLPRTGVSPPSNYHGMPHMRAGLWYQFLGIRSSSTPEMQEIGQHRSEY